MTVMSSPAKMSQQYHPDPDDSEIVFNIPPPLVDPELEKYLTEEEDSDDEAPEDVPFTQSKEAALSSLKAEEQCTIDAKNQKKDKMLKKQALFLQQKEEKAKRLQVLASKRLPEQLLDEIPASGLSKLQQAHLKNVKRKKNKHQRFDSAPSRMESEHYIPLTSSASESSTNFNVAILGSKKWKNRLSKPGDIASKDFRQKALFNPHIRRVPTNHLEQTRAKQAASGNNTLIGSS